ncbi:hypothetical protein TrispH2_009938 [Trichoplax sp. H2]|uniref:Uncharacterized protein n=1 Tax=Trichoplax adhaerens TaxID=10228 RepID=B3RIX7_TRIAD|nr:predicted protein [Trichoplax adhaerens]EDV28469.1 predicted protein [Trichoplax adhaerens]RDD38461.1 hypothetical protein TrispH2_009938 [Trichoplax sp. H2]|eukprot:XP_002107671.1 predicted protein [Trichoplax adhaerens]
MKNQVVFLWAVVFLACCMISIQAAKHSTNDEYMKDIDHLQYNHLVHKWAGLKAKNHPSRHNHLAFAEADKTEKYYARSNDKYRRCYYQGACNSQSNHCCIACDVTVGQCLASPPDVDPFP